MKARAATSPVRADPGQILLAITAFLIPLMGGQVAIETAGLTGGFSDVVTSLFGGSDLPTLSHLVLATFVLAAFVWLVAGRRVIQTPNNTLSASVAVFFAVIVVTTGFATFRELSVAMTTEWLVYGIGFFAVVGLGGRRFGPRLLMTALFAGCFLAAWKGFVEYGENKAIDPTWRIYGGWNNPNALAAMLLIGFFVGIGITLTQDRVRAFVAGICTTFVAMGILLTQSKGAILVMVLVGIGWGVTSFLVKSRVVEDDSEPKRPLGLRAAAIIGGIVLFFFVLQIQQRAPATAAGGSAAGGVTMRLTSLGESADQSAGFRKLLWRTSLALIKENPAGYGLGAFRYESGRPGLTTQTVFGHSTYLQLAVEGSVVLPLLLLVVIVAWLRLVFRAIRNVPRDSQILLLSIVAAVAAVLAHSVVDSDLYYFGVGLATFMLMGIGLLLSADAVAPEFLFPIVRGLGSAVAACVLLAFGYFAVVEYVRAEARADVEAQNGPAALDAFQTLHSIAPADPDSWYLSASVTHSVEDARNAVATAPNTRNLRLLARLQRAAGDQAGAETSYSRALALDPDNLSTLYQRAELEKQNGDAERYESTLRRLIAVENTDYFKIRSLPELVPIETYEARIQLAEVTGDSKQKIGLLKGAVAGLRKYVAKTVPNVVRMAKANPPMDYGGISLAMAKEKLAMAADAAKRLAELDRQAGDKAGAEEADKDSALFASAIG